MEELNILTRVIQTQPQSFIEGNIERICFLLTGANPINNKDISLSLLDTGGFQFTNLVAQNSNQYSGTAFKSKDDFLSKINDFLGKKNEALTKAFSNQKNDFSFPFFPRQYMKPVAAYPNLGSGKFGKFIRSWTAIYKIEIPAYENPITRRTEYANVSNAGIEITVSSGGKIIGLKYNLLPLEARRGVPLFKVISDENEIPQLTYLLNKKTNTVAPFYLATTEETYIPATKESILPKPNDNEILFHNHTDFDRGRIVVWLKRVGLKRRLKVKDASSTNERSNSNIQLPVGAKLIRLKPNNTSDKTTPCMYWWNGGYHQSSVPEANLGTNNVVLSNFSGQTVKNDVEHLINRISEYEKKQNEYDEVIKKIKDFSNKTLIKKQIEDGLVAIATSLKLNTDDKPATISIFQDSIYQVYNPKINDTTLFSDETLILPLSFAWFNSDNKMLERFNAIWLKSSSLGNRFEGSSGEGVNYEPALSDIKDELLQLKDIANNSTVKNSPEAKWLQTLSSTSLDNIKRFIFINDNTWHLSAFDRYAEYIAIENSFGPFRLPPILNVIIHEFTVNSGSFLPFANGETPDGNLTDTHIPDNYTQDTWNKANSSGLGVIQQNQNFVDHLYQSHRAYASIALAIIISKISN
jgi:hypothetical protein